VRATTNSIRLDSTFDNALATPPYFPPLLAAYLASIKFFRASATAVVAPSEEEDGWL
jgi:hypothetical protein